MKKVFAVTFLAAIFLLCGCGADPGSIIVTSEPQGFAYCARRAGCHHHTPGDEGVRKA